MTSLPSFVELMASLGLDQATKTPDQTLHSSNSSPSSSPRFAGAVVPLHARSKSIQSLRDTSVTRQRVARYSPYSPVLVCEFLHLFDDCLFPYNQSATRRGSLSSMSSSSLESDRSPLRVSPIKMPYMVFTDPFDSLTLLHHDHRRPLVYLDGR